jgi:hypothetical protein
LIETRNLKFEAASCQVQVLPYTDQLEAPSAANQSQFDGKLIVVNPFDRHSKFLSHSPSNIARQDRHHALTISGRFEGWNLLSWKLHLGVELKTRKSCARKNLARVKHILFIQTPGER